MSISELLTDQFSFPGNGGMNLGTHDKEFQFERMTGKINSEAGGRPVEKKAKHLENLVKWQFLFAGQKYIMKSKSKNPINQTSILKLRQISLLSTSPGNQGNHT